MKPNDVEHDDVADDAGQPSKTQRKQEMHELQRLGQALLEMPETLWQKLALEENLQYALKQAKSITAHEGRRRQMQWIGKLMRRQDAEVIRKAVENFEQRGQVETAKFHNLERWRERLLKEPNAQTAFISAYPQTNAQQLGSLLRRVKREQELSQPPRAFRELFQFIKTIDAEQLAAKPMPNTLDLVADELDDPPSL